MLDTVKRTISDYMMLETGGNVLVALSGGADSTALLLSLRELGYAVRAFHLNHCLRGAESDRDEAFCRRLCETLGVELTVERVDIAAAAGDSAVEETARRIRYARLEHAAHGAKIAVAQSGDHAVPFGARHRCERSHGHSAGARTHHSASHRG